MLPYIQENRDVEFLINGTKLCGFSKWYPRQEVLVIPEGVEVIGIRALTQANCDKLVMPSTLKEIKEKAFYNAKIGEIDFGDCKLKRIGSEAFYGCEAKTELPDTVEIIYRYGICSLDIKKGKTIRLPTSLRCYENIGISLKDVEVLEIGEKMFEQGMLLEGFVRDALVRDGWVTVKVMRLGASICEFVIFRKIFGFRVFETSDILDYQRYDENMVSEITSMPCKVNAAAMRLLRPVDLSSENERLYRDYVKRNFLGLIRGKEEDIETIRKYDEAGFVTIYRLKQLLKMATDKQNIEVSAFLVDLIGKKEGAHIKSLKL